MNSASPRASVAGLTARKSKAHGTWTVRRRTPPWSMMPPSGSAPPWAASPIAASAARSMTSASIAHLYRPKRSPSASPPPFRRSRKPRSPRSARVPTPATIALAARRPPRPRSSSAKRRRLTGPRSPTGKCASNSAKTGSQRRIFGRKNLLPSPTATPHPPSASPVSPKNMSTLACAPNAATLTYFGP